MRINQTDEDTSADSRSGAVRRFYVAGAVTADNIVPYSTRHTYAAWSLATGVHPNKLVNRMGHASKAMVYEVYGRYIRGLDKDENKIKSCFGSDFH